MPETAAPSGENGGGLLRRLWPGLKRRTLEVFTDDILERDMSAPPPTPRYRTTFGLHRATSPDDPRLAVLPGDRRRLAGPRLRRGDVLYIGFAGDEVAAWVWSTKVPAHRAPWSGLRFRLAPNEAYSYDLYAAPAHRHDGAGAFVMAALLSDLHEDPACDRVYTDIGIDNRPSQMLNRMVFGFTDVQRVRCARILDRWGAKVPFSDAPHDGPCSRSGRRRPGEAALRSGV